MYHYIFSVQLQHLSSLMRKPTMWFQNRSDTNRDIQALKMARGWKFRIWKEEELYYKTKELISFADTTKLICAFVFANTQIVGFLIRRLIYFIS